MSGDPQGALIYTAITVHAHNIFLERQLTGHTCNSFIFMTRSLPVRVMPRQILY